MTTRLPVRAALLLACVVTSTLASLDPVVNELYVWGINRTSGALQRYDLGDGGLVTRGNVRLADGTVLTGIDASAYIPGHQNIIAFWNDPDNVGHITYVDVETARATFVGQDLGPGKITGAVAGYGNQSTQVSGFLELDPQGESVHTEFVLTKANGGEIEWADLDNDPNVSSNGTYYQGQAKLIQVKPGRTGTQSNVIAGGQNLSIRNEFDYTFAGTMDVRIWAGEVVDGKGIDDWRVDIFSPTVVVQGVNLQQGWSVFALQRVEAEEDDDVNFLIVNDTVVPLEAFAVEVTILGAAITAGGDYNVPVTTQVRLGSSYYQPFGSFSQPLNGNVNDNLNPRRYVYPNLLPAGTTVDVLGRSWIKRESHYSGESNAHWQQYLTVDGSATGSPQLIVLRNGDPAPNIQGYLDQTDAVEFVRDFVDFDTNTMVLDENQAIFLYELGTTNMHSSAADFQDLVALVTLAKHPDDFDEDEDDDDGNEAASRLVRVDHRTGGYIQLMTLDRVYDGLATREGRVFYGTHGDELYKIDVLNQTESLVGTMPREDMFGLEFAGQTLMAFSVENDRLYPIDVLTGAAVTASADVGMLELGTITFMRRDDDPALLQKSYD